MARPLLYGRVVRNKRVLAAGLGGIAGSVLDIAVLVACVESSMSIALAAFLGASAGAVACFLANKYWAFRDPRPLSLRQAGSFGLVAVGTALLMAAAMWLVAAKLGVPYLMAKAICAAVVFLVWSYPAQRRFVFVPA
jgi:putative flippase GtrA